MADALADEVPDVVGVGRAEAHGHLPTADEPTADELPTEPGHDRAGRDPAAGPRRPGRRGDRAGHAPHHAGGLVLHQDLATGLADVLDAAAPVVPMPVRTTARVPAP
jgi:hypothetical protein